MREGIELERLTNVDPMVDAGLLQVGGDRAVLTLKGRLLADHVIRSVT